MLRLLLVVLAFFVVWALFFSPFTKRQRILITLSAVLLAVVGIWYEEGGEKPKVGLINSEALKVCGLTASHSYRTNYDIRFCLKNEDTSATLKRLTIVVSAEQCQQDTTLANQEKTEQANCEIVEQVSKALSITLLPGEQVWLNENLTFDKVNAEQKTNWSMSLIDIKAKR